MSFTKIIVNPQMQICICPQCNFHTPLGALYKVTGGTTLTCEQCNTIIEVINIVEQTLNVSVKLDTSAIWDDKYNAVYQGVGVTKESTPTVADGPNARKAKNTGLICLAKSNDVQWGCPSCNEMNFELLAEDMGKGNCAYCDKEVTFKIL